MQNTNKKQGKKLFGIFNVIDIVFIVVVIIAVGLFAWKKTGSKVDTKTYVIGFYSEEVSDFVANNLKVGDRVAGDSDFDDLGEIIDIDISNNVCYGFDDEGVIRRSSKEGYKAVSIYCKVSATSNDYGLFINGHTYLPGHSFTMYTDNNAKIYLRVLSLQEVTEYDDAGNPVFEKPDKFIPLDKMEYAITNNNVSASETEPEAEPEIN